MKTYKVIIELYNEDGKYKADYFERNFGTCESAFNYSYVIINEIINDKQLDYKSIKIIESDCNVIDNTLVENKKIINEIKIKKEVISNGVL